MGGGFSPVCLRPLCYQLLMSIKLVTIYLSKLNKISKLVEATPLN